MNLVKRNPDNWLPTVFDDFMKTDWLGGTNLERQEGKVPAVNIKENEDNFIVQVAAPGKEKEDFKIELDNEVLSISSEDKQESKEENEKFTRREFCYSSFRRVFQLPETVNNDEIKANYDKGILNIILPKREEAKVQPKRMIEIQ